MQKTGLLGYPINHSLSPTIHNRAYQELGLDWHYELFSCPNLESFSETLDQARSDEGAYVGFNVTTPYKVAAHLAADSRSHYSEVSGSANVLTFAQNKKSGREVFDDAFNKARLIADNTDGRGLVESLKRGSGRDIDGASVVLCGSGAVAMSALLSLLEEGVCAVDIASRNPSLCKRHLHGLKFADKFNAQINAVDYTEAALRLSSVDFLIDATTVGMKAGEMPVVPADALHSKLVVLDVVYGHGETQLIKAARDIGALAFDGLDMLVEQAALTIEIWAQEQGFEVVAPRESMRQAALA